MLFDLELDVVRTVGAGTWGPDGKYSGGITGIEKILASVQPLSGKQAQLLPEGRRIEDAITIFTNEELFTAKSSSNKKADVVLYRGGRYEVFNVKIWTASPISHFEVIALGELK